MNRDNYIESLKNGVCEIVFTKADGTARTLTGTLQEESLPEGVEARQRNDAVVTLWDLEADDWRSFRTDSVISFSAMDRA